MSNWQFYVRKEPIVALKLDEITFVKVNGYSVKGNIGDYLCSTKDKKEQWIVSAGTFHKAYKSLIKKTTKDHFKTWNIYQELLPIKAKELTKKIVLQNEESRKIGEKGDYLCTNQRGDYWIVPKSIITSDYIKLKKRNTLCW